MMLYNKQTCNIWLSIAVAGRDGCSSKPLLVANLTHQTNINPLMGTLNPHSNGPLYSNTVIGTLAADGWAVTFGTARRGLGRLWPAQPPPRCSQARDVHKAMRSCPSFLYQT